MTELERFEKMAKLARERKYFENALHDIKDYHFESGTFNLNIKTGAYKDNRRYKGMDMKFNKALMKDYLTLEIKRLTKEIDDLVSGLQVVEQELPEPEAPQAPEEEWPEWLVSDLDADK